MGKDLLSIEKRKELVQSGVSKISPRKQALLYRQTEPLEMTGPILSAIRRGVPPGVAAGLGNCTLDELKYMIELGEAGSPAYREFRDEYIRARSEPVSLVTQGIYDDAIDETRRTVTTQKLALQVLAPELLEESQNKGRGTPAVQSQHFTVNIQEKFEATPMGGVMDADYEEVE